MSIKITRGDITVEVSTQEELELVLDTLNRHDSSRKSSVEYNGNNADILSCVYKTIPPYTKAYEILTALKDAPDGIIDTELINKLNLGNMQALGGSMGAISRRANEAGSNFIRIIESSMTKDGEWRYKLTDAMRKAMDDEKA
jgi:hypothetical protein